MTVCLHVQSQNPAHVPRRVLIFIPYLGKLSNGVKYLQWEGHGSNKCSGRRRSFCDRQHLENEIFGKFRECSRVRMTNLGPRGIRKQGTENYLHRVRSTASFFPSGPATATFLSFARGQLLSSQQTHANFLWLQSRNPSSRMFSKVSSQYGHTWLVLYSFTIKTKAPLREEVHHLYCVRQCPLASVLSSILKWNGSRSDIRRRDMLPEGKEGP